MFELLAFLLLLGLLALAGYLVMRLKGVAEEAQQLRRDISALRDAQAQVQDQMRKAGPKDASPAPLAPPPAPKAPPPRQPVAGFAEPASETVAPPQLPSLGATRLTPPKPAPAVEAQLPLLPEPTGAPPLPLDVLIRALQFPETEDDTEGFRALRRALRDHRAGQLIQAAQDVLTLLSQDGLYMDDLPPDRARPELWRRFAQGERGGPISALGGIRDRAGLSLIASRMREDPVFRDAAHHFLRRFDKLFSEFEPSASDAQIVDLADTRSTRAFMLLGRVLGIFD